MTKIRLPIDLKSLYYNIFNDNEKGHTCTVATPLKQGKSVNTELSEIFRIPRQIDFQKYPDFVDSLIKNSKTRVKINNVFVFDKLRVNGRPIESFYSYCIFIKQEIDPSKIQFGRIKIHYPFNLKNDGLNIDNKKVILSISESINNYAFIVRAFEYDFDDNSLNFDIQIVGYKGIPYSKVFINNKGVGNKFSQVFGCDYDNYDREIIYLKKIYADKVSPENYSNFIKKSKNIAISQVVENLRKNNYKNIEVINELYPYSLFDIQYYDDGYIKYAIVFGTFGNKCYADLSSEKIRFINMFNNAKLFIVTDCLGEPVIHEFTSSDIEHFKNSINSIRLIKGE